MNDINVLINYTNINANVPDRNNVVPVSAGDIVKWTTATIYDDSAAVIDFYPCK